MKTNAGHLHWAGTLLAILLVAATLSACRGVEESSEETARPTPVPTSLPTPTPPPASGSARMSLDEYAAFCAEIEADETTEEEGQVTYAELLQVMENTIGLLESINPPEEASVWHIALLASQRETKAAVDEYPGSKDDPIELEQFFSLAMAQYESLSEAIQEMDPAFREWLVAAGCIDEEMAAATSDVWWDDVTEEIEGEELTIGAVVKGSLDEAGVTDHFFFRAQEGMEYMIEAVSEELRSIRVELTDRRTFSKIRDRSRQPLRFSWTAPESGEYHLYVTSGSGTGSYTVSVSINAQALKPMGTATPVPAAAQMATSTPMATAEPTTSPGPTVTPAPTAVPTDAVPSGPTNVRYAIEGSAIRVSWEAVEGADYYNVYHDGFFDSFCTSDAGGRPSFCQELATNVIETIYLHTEPDGEENYYWVVACNQGGCSEIDSENPGGPVVDRPASPPSLTYAWEENAIRVSWEAAEGADYYKVYHHDFFDSSCSLFSGSSPKFCEELATNVVETSYLHTEPGEERNFYWVVACNQGGCSEIDSKNPAKQGEDGATRSTEYESQCL